MGLAGMVEMIVQVASKHTSSMHESRINAFRQGRAPLSPSSGGEGLVPAWSRVSPGG